MNTTAGLIFLIASSLLFASDENPFPKRCLPKFSSFSFMFFKKSCNKKIVPITQEDINNQILKAITNDDSLKACELIQCYYFGHLLNKDFVNQIESALANTANTSMSTDNMRALMKIVDEKTPKN